MLSAAVWLLCNSLFFSLRLAGNPGSFPRPLSAAEEKEYLERFAAGDLEARRSSPTTAKRSFTPRTWFRSTTC